MLFRSPPVAETARALGIPVEQPESVNDPAARELIARAGAPPDGGAEQSPPASNARRTVIVCAFGALIKEPLLSEHDVLNVHPSLLPRWRGAAPIERAIMAGDATTGVSIIRLTAGLDSGPVCLAAAEPIGPQDTYGSLSARLQELGGELLVRALDESPPFLEQAGEGVTYAEKLGPEDRLLDPHRPAVELERVVRALDPHVGARVALADGTLLGVRRAALAREEPEEPEEQDEQRQQDAGPAPAGEGSRGPVARGGRLLLECEPGVLELLVVQPPGARAMAAADYLRGHPAPGRR